jgi:arylsulfatase A
MGDNGTANGRADRATIGGRRLAGAKGSMLEGGGLVPLIASWPGTTQAGQVSQQFIDASDMVPTFAALAGAKLPPNTTLDGRSFSPQLRGEEGQPREWIFNQLAKMWYVREAGWKLNQAGELYDMSDAPFAEKLVAAGSKDPGAIAARKRLQPVLDRLNPAGGILDEGDGTGRHANRQAKSTTPANSRSDDRAAKFDRLDKDQAGKLTREQYVSSQSDPAAAAKRFEKFDADQDGIVTREEFINGGTRKTKSP